MYNIEIEELLLRGLDWAYDEGAIEENERIAGEKALGDLRKIPEAKVILENTVEEIEK